MKKSTILKYDKIFGKNKIEPREYKEYENNIYPYIYMDKIYTEEDIKEIKNITDKYKANNFAVPLFHLSITIFLMIIILYTYV